MNTKDKIKAAKKARNSARVDGYVAKFLAGGASKKRHFQSLKERFLIFTKHYGFMANLFNHGLIALRWTAHHFKK